MADHEPSSCPNKLMIDSMAIEIQKLKESFHSIDKDNSTSIAVIKNQYETIINMLVSQGNEYKDVMSRVLDIEKKFILNDYKTNESTDLIKKVTWGMVAKVGALLIVVGTFLISAFKQ